MKLTVKTLKGEKFTVDAELSNTVAEVKVLIEAAKPALSAATMRLIHSGKILKDDDIIEACNIKPNSFLVVMITKAKKAAVASVPAATPAPVVEAKAPAAATTSTSTSATPATSGSASTPAPAPSSTSETSSTGAVSVPEPSSSSSAQESEASSDTFPTEMVANLTGMGFPEAEVRACLRAAQGNPDIAVEFLMNGIPPGVQQMQQQASSASTTNATPTGAAASGPPLQVLRNHPQINQLRRLVQENPSTLQSVLTQIGQQQPELLQEINGNQQLFLEIMNEPVEEDSAPASSSTAPSAPSLPAGTVGQNLDASGMLNNPAQMSQMLQNMSPEQMQSLAAMMGFTPDQLSMTAQMISRMPPEELQNYMNAAMQAGGGDMAGLMGSAGGQGAAGGGPQVLELSQEEMAAVDRLADMGFDRTEAAQAYMACDKNEALAANLLMDGGFGFGDGGNAGGTGGSGGNNDNDGDDMYD